MAKKSSGMSGVAIGVLIVLGLLVQALQNYWPVLLILGGVALAFWMFRKPAAQTSSAPQVSPISPRVTVDAGPDISRRDTYSSSTTPTVQDGDQLWLPEGKTATVAGYMLNGGLLYIGKGLVGGNGYRLEAALIDPSLPVNKGDDDYTVRKLNYWPSYSEASREARASYLNWLAKGGSDPRADIGYVFLYFYGLERRALVDAIRGAAAKAELPAILREVERLLTLYGDNSSFHSYATSLLDLLKVNAESDPCWDSLQPLTSVGELTFAHRLCLGRMSSMRKALPGEWAYLWMMGDPTTRLNTAAKRCPEEFKRAFLEKYAKEFGEGMLLPQNKTRLKVSHRPASPSLQSSSQMEKSFDLPDVTVLSSPMKKLHNIAEACMVQLDAYSRFLGRNPDKAATADALLELPFNLWPDQFRQPIKQLSATIRTAGKPMVVKFEKLTALLPDWPEANRDRRYRNLSRALAEAGLGIEPDTTYRGKTPLADSTVVLFSDDAILSYRTRHPEYDATALTLHLAVSISIADGEIGEGERQLLLRQLEDRLHLNASDRRRLQAHLRLLMTEPLGLNNLKKRIEALSLAARQAIGEFLTEVAKADNEVTPAEVQLLEKIFKMLGLDVQSVYGMLHVAAEAPVTIRPSAEAPSGFAIPRPPKPKEAGVELDMGRIAALHAESEKVAAILGAIFTEEAIQPEPAPEPQEVETVIEDSLMGLDAEQTALVRLLCARPEWSREELEELAQDRGIMLDGALEHINEAAFDKHDQPFSEGEDPVEINQEVVKEILQ